MRLCTRLRAKTPAFVGASLKAISILHIASKETELHQRDRDDHQKQDKGLRGSNTIAKLLKAILINLLHNYLGAIADATGHHDKDLLEHLEAGDCVEHYQVERRRLDQRQCDAPPATNRARAVDLRGLV